MEKDWLILIGSLAWPVVALIALLYVWKSDALGKLLRITKSVDELKGCLADLADSEVRLQKSAGSLQEFSTLLETIQNDFRALKADVENIADKVDQKTESILPTKLDKPVTSNLPKLFDEMDKRWQSLNQILEDKFGWFDKRATAGEVYRFAHGNRKGMRLAYDDADEISRLHSLIKSYRRRQSSLTEWLDQEKRDEFVDACDTMAKKIAALQHVEPMTA